MEFSGTDGSSFLYADNVYFQYPGYPSSGFQKKYYHADRRFCCCFCIPVFAQIGLMYFDGLNHFYLNFTENTEHIHLFNYSIFWTYGAVLALGTIIPPILFNIGFERRIGTGKYCFIT
jgi:hypothetical protein